MKRKTAILNRDKEAKNDAEKLLKDEQAKSNMGKIYNNINSLKTTKNSQKSIWKLKNKILPKIKPPLPVAKKNIAGKLITNNEELKNVYLTHFHHRMRKRPILQQFEGYQKDIEREFSQTLEITKNIHFSDWSIKKI